MKTNIIRRMIGLVLTLGGSAASALMCYPPNEDKGVVYNDAQQPRWYVWEYNSIADTQAVTTGMNGNHAIKVTYTQNWGEFILFRSSVNGGEQLWHTGNYRALVFRVKGIHNNCEKQLWMHLREESGVTYEPVPITKYIVSPESTVYQDCWGYPNEPVGQYDPNKWYTVVIPPNAFLNYSPITQPDLIIKDVIFEGGHLADYAAGETATVYLDDIWWIEGLEFPLREGENGNPAWRRTGYPDITSVFDHSQPGTAPITAPFPSADNMVVAYTGETGDGAGYTGAQGADDTCRTGLDAPFDVDGQYRGAFSCGEEEYLSYNGHPAIDWKAATGTPIYAPASGEITLSDCEQLSSGISCDGKGTGYGKLIINLDGPYTVSFNHNSFVADGLGKNSRVSAGQLVGYSGNTSPPGEPVSPHLHMSLSLDDSEFVDPYGWVGLPEDDPYHHRAVNVYLWKVSQ